MPRSQQSVGVFRYAALMIGALAVLLTEAFSQDLAELATGQQLVQVNCARCHAIGRSDLSPHPEAPPFRTLTRRYPIASLVEALVEGLWVNHPDMPEFIFSPEQANAIISYIENIQE